VRRKLEDAKRASSAARHVLVDGRVPRRRATARRRAVARRRHRRRPSRVVGGVAPCGRRRRAVRVASVRVALAPVPSVRVARAVATRRHRAATLERGSTAARRGKRTSQLMSLERRGDGEREGEDVPARRAAAVTSVLARRVRLVACAGAALVSRVVRARRRHVKRRARVRVERRVRSTSRLGRRDRAARRDDGRAARARRRRSRRVALGVRVARRTSCGRERRRRVGRALVRPGGRVAGDGDRRVRRRVGGRAVVVRVVRRPVHRRRAVPGVRHGRRAVAVVLARGAVARHRRPVVRRALVVPRRAVPDRGPVARSRRAGTVAITSKVGRRAARAAALTTTERSTAGATATGEERGISCRLGGGAQEVGRGEGDGPVDPHRLARVGRAVAARGVGLSAVAVCERLQFCFVAERQQPPRLVR